MVTETAEKIIRVPLEEIQPNPYQPPSRIELEDDTVDRFGLSILEHGLLQIPICRLKDGVYQMGDGWLRLAGYKMLRDDGNKDYEEIPVIVRELSDRQMADLVLESNAVRKDLTPIELAGLYKKYLEDFDMTQEQLAELHCCSQGEIANTIRLLDLPDTIQQKIISQEITETHGRTLLQLKENPKKMATYVEKIKKDNISVADLDRMVKSDLWNSTMPLYDEYQYKLLFDVAECRDCPKRQMLKAPWGGTEEPKPRCQDKRCWEQKQLAAKNESQKTQIEKLAQQGITKIYGEDQIKYGQYNPCNEWFFKGLDNPAECQSCPRRAGKWSYNNKLEIICPDTKCYGQKRDQKVSAEEQEDKEAQQKVESQITEVFAGLDITGNAPISAAIVCLLSSNCTLDIDELNALFHLVDGEIGQIKEGDLEAILEKKSYEELLRILLRLAFEIHRATVFDGDERLAAMLASFQGGK